MSAWFREYKTGYRILSDKLMVLDINTVVVQHVTKVINRGSTMEISFRSRFRG